MSIVPELGLVRRKNHHRRPPSVLLSSCCPRPKVRSIDFDAAEAYLTYANRQSYIQQDAATHNPRAEHGPAPRRASPSLRILSIDGHSGRQTGFSKTNTAAYNCELIIASAESYRGNRLTLDHHGG